MKTILFSGLVSGLTLILPATAALAQTPAVQTQTKTYVPADFSQFAPRTALDMVSQIAGFSINNANNGARGFGQAQENVLINGQRISSKSTSASQALSRIPATNVEKIEILDGASLDIPGLSGQVANVTAKADGVSGTWTQRLRIRENLPPAFEWFEVSLNGQNGPLGWTLGLQTEPGRGASAGRETITNADGQVLSYNEESFTFVSDYIGLNGSLNWKPSNGHIANLNAEYNLFEPDERETIDSFSPDGTLQRQAVFQFKENEWNSEVSGDYEFGLGPGRLKLIGLQRNEHSPTRAKFFGVDLDGQNVSDNIFDRTVDESESILRSEYSWSGKAKSDWQVSIERALNTLESEAALFEGAEFGTLTPIDIGDPDIKVEEERYEAFISHGRQLAPDLRLQVSLGLEQSEISSDGERGQTRRFTRPKGSAALAWTVHDKLTLNASLERQIGQLNFFDFVSNIDLNRGDDQRGNENIVPSQRWRAELEAERNFGDWGALTASVFAEDIEDLSDQVPIGAGEGPGNIEQASRFGAEVEGTLKFDKLGWKGAQLVYEAFAQDTFLDDPLTGETRDFNGETIYYYELRLRHDVENTDWAWGLTYESFRESPVFRRNVRRYFEQPQGFMWGFIEHKNLWGMTGTAYLGNILDSDDVFQRIIYAPDRTGVIETIEQREANFGPVLTLRLKGEF